MIQDRTSVLPKAFIELTLGFFDVLKMALFTFYQVYEIFLVARYGVGDTFFTTNKARKITNAISCHSATHPE